MDEEFRGKGVVAYQAFTVYHFSNDKDLLYFAVISTKKIIKMNSADFSGVINQYKCFHKINSIMKFKKSCYYFITQLEI